MADRDAISERGRSLEEDYFRKKDRELVEKIRRNAAAAEARRDLGEKTGSHDETLLQELLDLGFTPDTVSLLPLLPVVQLAWAEGGITPAERALIVQLARSRGIEPGSAADNQLTAWMTTRPTDAVFDRARRLIRAMLESGAAPSVAFDGCQPGRLLRADCRRVRRPVRHRPDFRRRAQASREHCRRHGRPPLVMATAGACKGVRRGPAAASDPAELLDRFLDRAELLDEWQHPVLGVVELLRLLQHFGRPGLRHHRHAVFVGGDDVAGVDRHPRADDRHVDAGDAIVVDRRRWRDAAAEHRELQLANLRRVADRGVDHRAGKAAVLHRGGHQAADAGIVGAVLEHHHVDRARR